MLIETVLLTVEHSCVGLVAQQVALQQEQTWGRGGDKNPTPMRSMQKEENRKGRRRERMTQKERGDKKRWSIQPNETEVERQLSPKCE